MQLVSYVSGGRGSLTLSTLLRSLHLPFSDSVEIPHLRWIILNPPNRGYLYRLDL